MTVGVKIVTFNAGASSVSFDTEGYVPIGALFFAGSATVDGTTEFFGAQQGLSAWCQAQYQRGDGNAIVGGEAHFGALARRDLSMIFLKRAGADVAVDTSGKIISYESGKLHFTWTALGLAAGSAITAIVFFGSQWHMRVGTAEAAPAKPADPSDLPYNTVSVGFQPGCVILGSGSQAFGLGAPITNPYAMGLAIGWATFPEPAYEPPTSTLTGHPSTSSSTFGQRAFAWGSYSLPYSRFQRDDNLTCGRAGELANYILNVIRLSAGFGLSHSFAGGPNLGPFGWVALKNENCRFVTGSIAPTKSASSDTFNKWGGTYSVTTDTNPSGHANPSFLFMMPNIADIGLYETPRTYFAADDGGTLHGYARGGGPATGPTTDTIEQLTGGHVDLMPGTLSTTPALRMDIASWDGDGIHVTYSTHPASGGYRWPYLAFTNDTGFLHDKINMAAREPRDGFDNGSSIFASRVSAYLHDAENADMEQRDRFAAVVHVTVGIVMAATEPRDTWRQKNTISGGAGQFQVAEYIYPRWEDRTFFPDPADLPFVITLDASFSLQLEDRVLHVPYEDRVVIVPPTEGEPFV